MKFCATCKHNDRSEAAVTRVHAALVSMGATPLKLGGAPLRVFLPADDDGGICGGRDHAVVVYLRSPSCEQYEEKPA